MNNRIRFTSSPWGFRYYDFEKYCEFLNEIGIKEICIFFGNSNELKEFKLAFNSEMSPDDIKRIKSIVSKNKQKIIEACVGGADYTVKEGIEKEIELTKKQIDIGAKFGIKLFILFAGWIKEEESTDKTYEQVSESLTEIGKYAKKYNITIVMENHGGVTRTSEQVLRIMKKIKSDNVGVNYDPANFRFHHEDEYKALLKIRDYVKFAHFKNCKEINGKMHHCRLSEGIIDYIPIFKELSKFYRGYYSLEYEESSDVELGTKDDFKFLKRILNETKVNERK